MSYKKSVYGSSIVLSRYIRKKFMEFPIELSMFIAFQEFEKYMRLRGYGINQPEIFTSIFNDISLMSSFYDKDYTEKIKPWLTVNFLHMEEVINEGGNDNYE